MKKIRFILPVVALILAAACREDNIMTWSGDDRIRFRTDVANDTLKNYSFLGEAGDVTRHVMYIEVNVEGDVRDFPRTITLRQVATGSDDAVAGTHYVAFDDAQVKAGYVIPAGAATVEIPVILLRDRSLLDYGKVLRVELVGNEYFGLTTDRNRGFRMITFAEKPVMPGEWYEAVQNYVNTAPWFGTYGPAKHRFMIEQTNMAFDSEWFNKWFARYPERNPLWIIPLDAGYVTYLRQLLQNRLNELNAAAGTGNELKESDGTVVRFL